MYQASFLQLENRLFEAFLEISNSTLFCFSSIKIQHMAYHILTAHSADHPDTSNISEYLYSDFVTREVLVYPEFVTRGHILCSSLTNFCSPPFVPGLGSSANVRPCSRGAVWEEGKATAAHEQPANISWESFSIPSNGHDLHHTQSSNAVDTPMTAGQASSAHVWPSTVIPFMDNWNCHLVHAPSKLQSPSVSPYAQLPCSTFDTDDTTGNHDANCQQQLDARNATSQHRTDSPSPSITRRGLTLKSTQILGSKQHQCSQCTLAFARLPDLQRQIDSVHLGIRHHCHEPRCHDNYGRGYCRSEKLKKHVREVHGHAWFVQKAVVFA